MKKNNILKEIGKELIKADSVLIFPHISMDGDAMGSSSAICATLRKLGKKAFVVIEDEIPEYISFLKGDYYTDDLNIIEGADVSLAIDCESADRFPKREETFLKGKKKICIDHHLTSTGIWDMNYIDPSAAATAEIIYDLIYQMGVEINKEIAEYIYTGIITDTGNFRYSNTTRKTHEIAMTLYDKNIDNNKISLAIYENESIEKLLLESHALNKLNIFSQGKGVITYVSQEMLKECKTTMEDSEGIVSKLRSLKGVEIAALLKEKEDGEIKVTMRAKDKCNVADIAKKYGGGGHAKAAGFTFKCSLKEAEKKLRAEIEKAL